MSRVHIRTDDEVYRVDAVWLGPPRATFPWRARYSAYGVGLLVMIVVMFVQRRLGIDLGFFSVAWALLITMLITRFVSRRINDERPLLEWLTLFLHELRGPRARSRGVGGPLAIGHVTVRRDRPRALGPATAVALPRPPAGADGWFAGPSPGRARGAPVPRVPADPARVAADPVRVAAVRVDAAEHLTPGLADTGPTHTPRGPRRVARRATTARREAVPHGDFGPPSTADVGPPETLRPARPQPAGTPPGLPPARSAPSAADEVAAWSRPARPGEPAEPPVRRPTHAPQHVAVPHAADRGGR